MDTVYAKHSRDMRSFCDSSSSLISKLDTHYGDADTLDAYLKTIGNRIEEAKNMPLAARKYVETHRSGCGDINAYLRNIDDKMERELDGRKGSPQNCSKRPRSW